MSFEELLREMLANQLMKDGLEGVTIRDYTAVSYRLYSKGLDIMQDPITPENVILVANTILDWVDERLAYSEAN